MNEFMVVCTFKAGIEMPEIMALAPQERDAAKALQEAGMLGAIRLATPSRKVFIEAFASDITEAEATVVSLPMGPLWDIEIYPIVQPTKIAGD
jgi:muconolactone delta-isomerase